MADTKQREPGASVDHLVDENASRVEVEDRTLVQPAAEDEPTIGATGPTNWWRIGLIALAIVAAILLGLQLLGGAPSTDVQPGTPTAQPEATPQN